MSRRRSRSHSIHKSVRRDVLPIANSLPDTLPSLRHFEDRRYYFPVKSVEPIRSFGYNSSRIVLRQKPKVLRSSVVSVKPTQKRRNRPVVGFSFSAPREVLICVRRKIRKQVLHALRKTGKVGQRRPRRGFYSSVSCRS